MPTQAERLATQAEQLEAIQDRLNDIRHQLRGRPIHDDPLEEPGLGMMFDDLRSMFDAHPDDDDEEPPALEPPALDRRGPRHTSVLLSFTQLYDGVLHARNNHVHNIFRHREFAEAALPPFSSFTGTFPGGEVFMYVTQSSANCSTISKPQNNFANTVTT